MTYELYREQQLYTSIEKAWEFFSSPYNLSLITPPELKLTVLGERKNTPIFKGMEIEYFVSPLLNIRLKWKTRITEVEFQKSFTDFQEKGPYKLWNHHHEFIVNNEGVLMIDKVNYQLPFSVLSPLAHELVVKKKLHHIFHFRYKILEKIFYRQN